jgi:hypothetical protein
MRIDKDYGKGERGGAGDEQGICIKKGGKGKAKRGGKAWPGVTIAVCEMQ